MKRLGFGVLAFILGTASLFAIQIAVTEVWAIQGVTWGPTNLALNRLQQIASLSTLFIAIFGGSLVGAIVGRKDALWVLASMLLVGVSIDGYVMFMKLGDLLPMWFRVSFVGLIPVATILAGLLSRQIRESRRWSSGTT